MIIIGIIILGSIIYLTIYQARKLGTGKGKFNLDKSELMGELTIAGPFADIYFLSDDRDITHINEFIDQYAPFHETCAEDYPVPLHSDNPTQTFLKLEDLFTYLTTNRREEFIVYLRNLDPESKIKYLIITFTDDEKVILGVSVAGLMRYGGTYPFDDPEIPDLFFELKENLHAEVACVTVEEPPPTNSVEFLEFARGRYVPLQN